jgi:hypothetical protein
METGELFQSQLIIYMHHEYEKIVRLIYEMIYI